MSAISVIQIDNNHTVKVRNNIPEEERVLLLAIYISGDMSYVYAAKISQIIQNCKIAQ
jgi:hypothetical protein